MYTPETRRLALAVGWACLAATTPSLAQITFFERSGFQGRNYTTNTPVPHLQRRGFIDSAASAVVTSERWQICEDANFQGRCTVLRPGQYPSLGSMGLSDSVSSVRSVSRRARLDEQDYAPHPEVVGDFRRREGERLFEAPVTAARAVFGPPEQRCWTEPEQVPQGRGDARDPSVVVGTVIGGILGYQTGAGTGQDPAAAGGAVAGAAASSNIGRNQDGSPRVTHDVQRCANVPRTLAPAYWDVTYRFRGQDHRVQLMDAPGRTVTVNLRGEPRA